MNIIRKVFNRFYYSPRFFWDGWAPDFIKDTWQVKIHRQHAWLLAKVRESSPVSMLEVGCGFGRNINFLIKNGAGSSIEGFDISRSMINLAKKRIDNGNVKLFVDNISDTRTKGKYDLVFTHGVLMHVKPSELEGAVKNLVRLSGKYLILIEQNYGGNKYTFKHDYRKYLGKQRIKIIEYKSDKKLGLDLIYAKVR